MRDNKPGAEGSPSPEREGLLRRCRERCLYLITDSEKSERRIREKLVRSGKYPEDIIEEAIAFLKEYNYLDDLRYAKRMIQSYAGKKSLREIEQKLFQRGISREEIRVAEADLQEEEALSEREEEALLLQIRKRCEDPRRLDPREKQKLCASLCRKGFSYERVRAALCAEEIWGLDP